MLATRKRGLFTQGFIVQNVGLLVAILAVGLLYSMYIRPRATEIEITQRILTLQGESLEEASQRSLVVIIKNFEQQACLTLMVWATILLTYKMLLVNRERGLLDHEFLQLGLGERVLPDDALDHYKELQARMEQNRSWHGRLLPAVILSALQRFHSTHSIQDASSSILERTQLAEDELDSDLSLIRYIAWAIPSIGFIGTVRGIGEALAQADKAIQGDISGVTESLGLAFNSTLFALILSIILMFMIHLLQSRQESLVQEIQDYTQSRIIDTMKVPLAEDAKSPFA